MHENFLQLVNQCWAIVKNMNKPQQLSLLLLAFIIMILQKTSNLSHNGFAQCYMTMINILFQRPTP